MAARGCEMEGMCYVNGKDLVKAREYLFRRVSQFDKNTDVNNMAKIIDALSIIERNLANSKFVLRVEDKELLERVGCI